MKKKNKRKKSKKQTQTKEGSKGHMSLLPKNRDLSLIILKGHLLLEEEINNGLEKSLCFPEALSKTKLDFQQRLCFLHSVIEKKYSENPEWATIEKMNIIRNLLSYNLNDEEIEKLVKSFLEEIEKIPDYKAPAKNTKTDNKLKKAFTYLCSFILNAVENSQ